MDGNAYTLRKGISSRLHNREYTQSYQGRLIYAKEYALRI